MNKYISLVIIAVRMYALAGCGRSSNMIQLEDIPVDYSLE